MNTPLKTTTMTFHLWVLSSKSKRAFTLLELLCVIGVTATLLALLFPVAESSLERARSVKCASNLRQLGMAIVSYQSDNDDFYPPLGTGDNYWVYRLRPYLQIPAQASYLEKTPSVFLCPDDKPTTTEPAWYSSYGLNYIYIQGGQGGVIPSVVKGVTVAFPSKIILLAEGDSQFGGVISYNQYGTYVGLRHGNKDSMNVLWFDQHISLEKGSDIKNSTYWGYNYTLK